MSDNAMRDIVAEAIGLVPDPDPGNALKVLIAAMRRDDLTLACTVREYFPLIAFGLFSLAQSLEKVQSKRKVGRPRISSLTSVDSFRAMMCWNAVTELGLRHYTNRQAIELVRAIEGYQKAAPDERAFPHHVMTETLEQSVSRGKRNLGFTGVWDCETCETIKAMP